MTVDPSLGHLEDFQDLVTEANKRGLKVMLEVVYNHTSHDSVIVDNFPWFVPIHFKIRQLTLSSIWSRGWFAL